MSNQPIKPGIESLKASVLIDTTRGENCFNENGCDHEFTRIVPENIPGLIEMGLTQKCIHVSKCSHKYCDKYKWIIDRAKHYAEKTGKTYEEIIEIFESNRTYWYMGYYQECNQPLAGLPSTFLTKSIDRVNLLEKEIPTWEYLASTLTYEHQQSVKNSIETKVENLKDELKTLNAKKRLQEIMCFNQLTT